MTITQRIISAAILFAIWTGLAIAGLAPVSDLVEAIKLSLMSLGIYHAVLTNPSLPQGGGESTDPKE